MYTICLVKIGSWVLEKKLFMQDYQEPTDIGRKLTASRKCVNHVVWELYLYTQHGFNSDFLNLITFSKKCLRILFPIPYRIPLSIYCKFPFLLRDMCYSLPASQFKYDNESPSSQCQEPSRSISFPPVQILLTPTPFTRPGANVKQTCMSYNACNWKLHNVV